VGFVVGRRSMVAAGSAGVLAGALLVGGAVAATASPAQSTAPTVTVSGAAQFRSGAQTYNVSLDVRGTATGGSGRCALSGPGLAASCTGISSVTRGTGAAADSATVVGTVRTSRGQNVAFRAVVTDRANPNGAGRDTVSATVDGRTVQGTVSNGNLVVAGSTPTTTTPTPPANRAPVVRNDTYTAAQDTTLTVPAPGVLGNDTDPDGNPVTVRPSTQPAHGTLQLNADGSFTYVPNPGYVGTDSFTYTATDGDLSSAPASVSITVQSPAPQANPDVDEVSVDKPNASGNVLTNDTPNTADNPLVVKDPTEFEKAFGFVRINRDGSYTYVLKDASARPAPPGDDQVTYTAVDGQGRESSSTLRIFVR
jgi:hypothetical protein